MSTTGLGKSHITVQKELYILTHFLKDQELNFAFVLIQKSYFLLFKLRKQS